MGLYQQIHIGSFTKVKEQWWDDFKEANEECEDFVAVPTADGYCIYSNRSGDNRLHVDTERGSDIQVFCFGDTEELLNKELECFRALLDKWNLKATIQYGVLIYWS